MKPGWNWFAFAAPQRFYPLAGRLLPGWDFVDGDADPSETAQPTQAGYGHGTHVAGIVALVAPGARIMPLRVLDVSGVKDLPAEYQHPLLMVRADAHTVWRGHGLDDVSAHTLVATLCGRQSGG